MMNVNEIAEDLMQKENQIGERMRKAMAYRDAAAVGEISPAEYSELLEDLQRLDDIELSSDELNFKIAFNEVMNALKLIPLN